MTSITEWDNELNSINKELKIFESLSDSHVPPTQTDRFAITAIQLQRQLQSNVSLMQRTLKKEHLLLHSEKTLFHWTEKYLAKVSEYLPILTKSYTRRLWIALLRKRLTTEETKDFQSIDLVELAVRQGKLKETEKLLSAALISLRKKYSRYMHKCKNISVAQVNHEAAATLNCTLIKENENWGSAWNNPLHQSIQTLYLEIIFPLRHKTSGGDQYDKEYANTAEQLIDVCGELILDKVAENKGNVVKSPKDNQAAENLLEQGLGNLGRLENNSLKIHNNLRSSTPQKLRRSKLQRNQKQAKTMH